MEELRFSQVTNVVGNDGLWTWMTAVEPVIACRSFLGHSFSQDFEKEGTMLVGNDGYQICLSPITIIAYNIHVVSTQEIYIGLELKKFNVLLEAIFRTQSQCKR